MKNNNKEKQLSQVQIIKILKRSEEIGDEMLKNPLTKKVMEELAKT